VISSYFKFFFRSNFVQVFGQLHFSPKVPNIARQSFLSRFFFFLSFFILQVSPPIFANCRLVPQTTSPESSPSQSNTTCQPLIGSKATWLPIKGAFTAMCQDHHSQFANTSNTQKQIFSFSLYSVTIKSQK
jgi:hypothetical protein